MRKALFLTLLIPVSLYPAHTPPVILGTLTATGVTAAVDLFNTYRVTPHKHTVEVDAVGVPTACTMELDGTLDPPTSATAQWSNLSGSQTCTAATLMFHIADKPVRGIRANLTAFSGTSVTILYIGVE